MSKGSNKKDKIEDKGRLDQPANVKRLIRWFYWLCGLVVLADFIFSFGWHKHAAFGEDQSLHGVETLPAFLWDLWFRGLCRFGLPLQTDEKLER